MKNKFIIIVAILFGMIHADPTERNCYILAKKVGDWYASNAHQRICLNEKIVIGLTFYDDETSAWHSSFEHFYLNGDRINALPINENKTAEIKWFIIFPQKTDTIYTNNFQTLLPWAFIQYEERELVELRNKQKINFTAINDYNSIFPGTVRVKAEIRYKNQFIATPGIEHRYVVPSGDYGGLDSSVFQLIVTGNSESTFINNLLSFRHIPYIENPGSWKGKWDQHQTVQLLGANMRTALVRSMELAGKDYHALVQHFPLPSFNQFQITDYHLGKIIKSPGGEYRYEDKVVQLSEWLFSTGDFLVCNSKIFVFYQDKSEYTSIFNGEANGILDKNDIVIGADTGDFMKFSLETLEADTLQLIRWNTRWHRDE